VAARMSVRVGDFRGMAETRVSCVADFSFDVALFGLVEARWSDIVQRLRILHKLRMLRVREVS
jgi:hypothetical protein